MNAVFTTREAAREFEEWVTYRDGFHVTEPLMEADHQYCGTKVQEETSIDESYNCPPASSDGNSDASLSQSTSAKSPSGKQSPGRSSENESLEPLEGHDAYQQWDAHMYEADGKSTAGTYAHEDTQGVDKYEADGQETSYTYQRSGAAMPVEDLLPGAQGVPTFTTTADKAVESRCKTRFKLEWTAHILPGTPMGHADSSDGDGFVHWPQAADSHFYLQTNILLRQAIAQQMGGGTLPDSDRIALSSVSHKQGKIDGTGCGAGVIKRVTYRLLFDTYPEAVTFRQWLSEGNAASVFYSLRRKDPVGVCGGRGDVGDVTSAWSCIGDAGGSMTQKFTYSNP